MCNVAPRAPRSSPAHLVFKFGCAVQQLLDLAKQLDTKNLSIKQTTRLQERMHDLDCALWPDEPHGEAKEAAIQNEGALADAQAKIEQLKNELQTARTAEHKVPAESSRGSLLDRVVIRPKEHSTRRSYANLFARYFPGVTTMTIHEPYLSSLHQVMNLSDFLEMAASASNGLLTRAVLYTNESSRPQQERLSQLASRAAESGRHLEIHFMPRLHNREIELSNGVVIVSDRGLDLHEAPSIGHRRQPGGRLARVCRNGVIDIFSREVSKIQPTTTKMKTFSPGRGRRVIATPKLARAAPESSKTSKRTTDGNRGQSQTTASTQELQSHMRQPEFEKEDEEKKADSQQIHDANIQEREEDLEREQAAMLAEHAAALAREEYEYFHDGNSMTNEQIKREAQNLAVWDLQGQHFFGDRYDARRVGNMYKDGTVHYQGIKEGNEFIITPADPYVFRVSDEYHELFINHYYDGADYVSEDHTEEASAADPSNSSAESDVPSSEESMNSSSDRE